MLNTPSLGSTDLDPNTQRALEQLAVIIGDVEQRLNLVKSTLAQIAPSLGSLPPGMAGPRATLGVQAASGFYPASVPSIGGPALGMMGMFPQNVPPFVYPTFAPFYQGVSAPLNIPMGSMAPTFPFRFG